MKKAKKGGPKGSGGETRASWLDPETLAWAQRPEGDWFAPRASASRPPGQEDTRRFKKER